MAGVAVAGLRGAEGKSCRVEKTHEAGEPERAGATGGLSGTAARKYRQMTESPIPGLVLSLAWPSIVSNLVTTVYNLADTFFIGQISTSAELAIGVAFVVMTLIQAIGFYFGQGTGNAMSRYLGMRNQRMADTMASVGMTASFGCGVAIAVLGHVFLVPLCVLAGSTPTILPYARTYIGLILIGAPWMCAALTLNQPLRFEGESAYAMVAFVSGAVLNFGLAPLLIFVAGLGIAGAGLATLICQFVSFCLLLAGMQSSHVAHLSLGALAWGRDLAREVNKGGLPAGGRGCYQIARGSSWLATQMVSRPSGVRASGAPSESRWTVAPMACASVRMHVAGRLFFCERWRATTVSVSWVTSSGRASAAWSLERWPASPPTRARSHAGYGPWASIWTSWLLSSPRMRTPRSWPRASAVR